MFAPYYITSCAEWYRGFLCDLGAILMRLGGMLEPENLDGADSRPRPWVSPQRWVRWEAQ